MIGAAGAAGFAMPAYRELVDAEYTKFRRRLLADKGSDRQAAFLEAAMSSDEFVEHLSARVATQGSVDADLSPCAMSEQEFTAPPPDTEADLYRSWSEVEPRTACRATFWAAVTCRHVREGRIQSHYLAAPRNTTKVGGAARIHRALSANGDHGAQEMDSCVRTILRSLGGIPEVRGKRTVYVDSPFGRAWWRERLVAEISGGDPDAARRVGWVLRLTTSHWEKIVDRIVSRNSTFGSPEVRRAFITVLADVAAESHEALGPARELVRAARRVSAFQAMRELSILDGGELRELMRSLLTVPAPTSN